MVYRSLQSWDKDDIIVTLQSFFLVSGIIIVVSHAVNGLITREVVYQWMILIPFILIGVIVGSHLYSRIDQKTFRKIIYSLLIIVAGLLFIR